jgi:hypothetical protein
MGKMINPLDVRCPETARGCPGVPGQARIRVRSRIKTK